MAPNDQIRLEEIGLAGILRHYRLFVPANQREYAWRDEEVRRLFEDFATAIHEDGPYFVGTVVTIPRDSDQLEVVDGQQRLATTTILMAAIRDYLRERGADKRVTHIEQSFLWGIDPDKEEDVPKLTMNVDDAELFRQIITGERQPTPTRISHRRLLKARDIARTFVRQIVAPLDERRHSDELNHWMRFLESRAEVILLRVATDATAYRMFETLNDRGLRTSQADLVKNYLYQQADARLPEVKARWSYMHGALDSAYPNDADALLTFLRHALIVQRGHLRQVDVYKNVQNMVTSSGTAVTFAGTLETLATTYVATSNPDHERWNAYPDQVRRAITAHNVMDIKPMRALLLAVGSAMEPQVASTSLSFLLSLAVRLNIASSTRSGAVEEPLANVARDVYRGKVATLSALRDALSTITPSDTDFRREFAMASVSNARLARYYLRAMETAYKGEPEPHYLPIDDRQIINLEHVLPIRPEPGWKVSDDDMQRLTNRLGNVVLMRAQDNALAGNRPFGIKRPLYAASSYELTRLAAQADRWDGSAIEARQAVLADLAVKTWPIKGGRRPKRADEDEEDVAEIAFRTMHEATGE